MADCRRCVYFVEKRRLAERLEYWEFERAIEFENINPDMLGWCKWRHKPVLYYVGSCRYYAPRQDYRDTEITQFLAGGNVDGGA